MAASVHLFVGLGNPGAQYELTRHNVGFMALSHLADSCNCTLQKNKLDGQFGRCSFAGEQVIFLLPQTYMNRSGICVRKFLDFFDVPVKRLLVFHDDLDMKIGRIKVVAKGGAGGHNGIKSIAEHLGTQQFSRVKIGIGRPVDTGLPDKMPVERYVLSPFSRDELDAIDDRRALLLKTAELFLHNGVGDCMNKVNGLTS